MPFNSTKVDTANKVITTNNVGGNFEGVNIFNGATVAIVYIADNNLPPAVSVCQYNNDPTVTVEDSTLLTVGDLVVGDGIPVDTKVLSITNGTTIELTASTTGGATDGPLEFHPLDNTICKFHVAADTTILQRGFDIICRKGIKIVSTNWANLEIFVIHN